MSPKWPVSSVVVLRLRLRAVVAGLYMPEIVWFCLVMFLRAGGAGKRESKGAGCGNSGVHSSAGPGDI